MERGAHARLQQRLHSQETTRQTRRHQKALNAYFQLPKYLTLPENTERIWQHRANLLPRTQHEYIVGSSILSEIAITALDKTSSERHALLDMATWDIDEAIGAAYSRQESRADMYHQKFLLSPNIIRLESKRAVMPLFRGMIEGDISKNVRRSYSDNILLLAARASEGFQFFQETSTELPTSRATEYIGLAHELNAIYSIARKHTPTLAAFPTFPRGDSGTHLPHQTHDIHVVGMQWGKIEESIIAEVKTAPKPEHYERYEAVLIGGTIHLHPDNSPDPSYLTELYVKENKGLATAAELSTIESISETVMHTVRHGFNNTEQCRDPKTCTLIS